MREIVSGVILECFTGTMVCLNFTDRFFFFFFISGKMIKLDFLGDNIYFKT